MKRLFFTVLAASAFTACKQHVPTALDVQQIKGPVKQTIETPYATSFRNGDWQKDGLMPGQMSMTFNYNEAGEDTSYVMADHEGTTIIRYVSEFDDNGVSTGGRSYNGDGRLESITMVQRYAANKLPLEYTSYSATSQDTFRNVSEFNDKMQLVHITIYHQEAEVLYDERIAFGEKGIPVKRTVTNSEGEKNETAFEYLNFDEKGNWIRRLEKGKDTVLKERKITYYK
ncbi:hypothetical protein [uncultured Chitinophaga sp.]|uniref:hypothetical protein n=1 Tax=uncultured Chitinophaga sp. TaxID=339340 RepID=UPI0025EA490B|nr:hypothetical protein [uncultured Chitinophaga sp.]